MASPPSSQPKLSSRKPTAGRAGGAREQRNGSAADGKPNGKLAQEISHAIESEIMALGWPIGQSLGSEADLIARFEVSRAVLREAVRIVEHHGVARMRRGPGGGLIITAPDTQAVVQSVTLLLDHADVTAENLFDARSSVELTCVRLAAEKIDEAGITRLREVLERERELGLDGVATGHPHELHIAIAEATGNPVLKLLVEILTRLTFERTASLPFKPRDLDEVHKAHVAVAEAIIAGDSALAQHRLNRHLAASTAYYRPRPRGRAKR